MWSKLRSSHNPFFQSNNIVLEFYIVRYTCIFHSDFYSILQNLSASWLNPNDLNRSRCKYLRYKDEISKVRAIALVAITESWPREPGYKSEGRIHAYRGFSRLYALRTYIHACPARRESVRSACKGDVEQSPPPPPPSTPRGSLGSAG